MPARRHGAAADEHQPTRVTHQDPSATTMPENRRRRRNPECRSTPGTVGDYDFWLDSPTFPVELDIPRGETRLFITTEVTDLHAAGDDRAAAAGAVPARTTGGVTA